MKIGRRAHNASTFGEIPLAIAASLLSRDLHRLLERELILPLGTHRATPFSTRPARFAEAGPHVGDVRCLVLMIASSSSATEY